MRRISIINTKGGCGKTTIASNLASCYAAAGYKTALFDYDPQGSSMRWMRSRPQDAAIIQGVAAFQPVNSSVTRTWQLRVPPETQRIIIDTPAGLSGAQLTNILKDNDTIIIPVLPSMIDIHATADFIRDLLLVGKVRRDRTRIAIIANRVKANTIAYQSLERFLNSLNIPFIAQIRETQNYIHASDQGIGIHEIKSKQTQQDQAVWADILGWLEETDTSNKTEGV